MASGDSQTFGSALEDLAGPQFIANDPPAFVMKNFFCVELSRQRLIMHQRLRMKNRPDIRVVGEAKHQAQANKQHHQSKVFQPESQIHHDIKIIDDALFAFQNHIQSLTHEQRARNPPLECSQTPG